MKNYKSFHENRTYISNQTYLFFKFESLLNLEKLLTELSNRISSIFHRIQHCQLIFVMRFTAYS